MWMWKDDGLTNKYIGTIDQLLGRKIRQVPFLSYIKKKKKSQMAQKCKWKIKLLEQKMRTLKKKKKALT